MLVGKEAGGGGEEHQQLTLCSAERRVPAEGWGPGPGLLLLQLVIPPCANPASASWQVGSWPRRHKPITDHCPVRNTAEGRGRQGQLPSQTLLVVLEKTG